MVGFNSRAFPFRLRSPGSPGSQTICGRAVNRYRCVAGTDWAGRSAVAHNAGFDRPFCEAFSHLFSGKAWACSNLRGYEGTKLGYLIGQAGYFHEGHRAVDDCFALLEVLAREVNGSASTAFAELCEASQRSRVRIFAENSPFDMKDHLKARGDRWSDGSDGRPKSCWIEVGEEALDKELHNLRAEIYRYPDADPPIKPLTAFDRFRA